MRKFLLTTVAVVALSAGYATASPFSDQIVTALQSQGFDRFEIREGTTQLKVEAIRGTTKVELIYDLATGAVLKEETSTVELDDDMPPGIDFDTEDNDFIDIGDDDNSDDDDSDEADEDDNSDNDDESDDDDESDNDDDVSDNDDSEDDNDDNDNDDDNDDDSEDDDSDSSDDDDNDDSDDSDNS